MSPISIRKNESRSADKKKSPAQKGPGFDIGFNKLRGIEIRQSVLYGRQQEVAVLGEPVTHDVGVFGRVVVMAPQNRNRAKIVLFEKELRVEVRLTNLEDDLVASLLRKLIDQLLNHLRADLHTTRLSIYREIQNVKLRFMKLINHESNDFLVALGNHADAVSLAKATEEVFFRPWELEALMLDLQNFRHIPADEPSDLNLKTVSFRFDGHYGLPAICTTAKRPGVTQTSCKTMSVEITDEIFRKARRTISKGRKRA